MRPHLEYAQVVFREAHHDDEDRSGATEKEIGDNLHPLLDYRAPHGAYEQGRLQALRR